MIYNLSKECILGIPWLVHENPIIYWKHRQVTIQQSSSVITLPIVRRHHVKPIIETVNLCNAKQVARWFHWREVDQAYLGFIRLVKDEKEQKIVPMIPKKIATECDVEKDFYENMPKSINVVLLDYKDISPIDLPPSLPSGQRGHEFKIELEDETPPIHRPIYKLSPLELEEARKQIQYILEHGYIRPSITPMDPQCCLHQKRMAVFGFVSTTAC